MDILERLKSRARAHPQRIVLPEGEDDRVIQASAQAAAERYAKPTLLGRPEKIRAAANRLGANLEGIELHDPLISPRLETAPAEQRLRRRIRLFASLCISPRSASRRGMRMRPSVAPQIPPRRRSVRHFIRLAWMRKRELSRAFF